jgi:hypothetical protein
LQDNGIADSDPTSGAFHFTLPVPPGVNVGSLLTAISIGSTSEFGPVVTVGQPVSSLIPVIDAGGSAVLPQGGRLERQGSFYDDDSTDWYGTVDYGDGTGEQPLALSSTGTFLLDHTYSANPGPGGFFLVQVRVTDNSLNTGFASFAVNIQNAPPEVTFNVFSLTSPSDEGQEVFLSGAFMDPGLSDIHFVDIHWGDSPFVQSVPVDPGLRTFSATQFIAMMATRAIYLHPRTCIEFWSQFGMPEEATMSPSACC